jgi:uncharacterized iron-regulated membrane protein
MPANANEFTQIDTGDAASPSLQEHAVNPRVFNRKLHRWGAVIVAAPFIVVLCTGILLQLKKQLAWVQPTELRAKKDVVSTSLPAILEVVRAIPHVGMQEWSDIDRLDVRPQKGVVKVIGHSRWEVQLDSETARVLQVAYRRSDLIESLHDGSWFHPAVKLFVFLPVGVLVTMLEVTGVYMWFVPILARRRRDRRLLRAIFGA